MASSNLHYHTDWQNKIAVPLTSAVLTATAVSCPMPSALTGWEFDVVEEGPNVVLDVSHYAAESRFFCVKNAALDALNAGQGRLSPKAYALARRFVQNLPQSLCREPLDIDTNGFCSIEWYRARYHKVIVSFDDAFVYVVGSEGAKKIDESVSDADVENVYPTIERVIYG